MGGHAFHQKSSNLTIIQTGRQMKKFIYWGSFDAFAVGDLDGDGSSDVAVLDPGNNGYLNLFYQNDTGTLDGPFLTTIQPTPFGIEIADIDNDGENEILGDASGYVFVFEREGSPPFSSYTTYTFPTISFGGSTVHQALSVGDVTGDGYADAVVTWGGEGLYVLPAVLNCTPWKQYLILKNYSDVLKQ